MQIFWWDMRKISEPTEVMYLDPTKKQDFSKAHAAVSLEYEPTIVRLRFVCFITLQFIWCLVSIVIVLYLKCIIWFV